METLALTPQQPLLSLVLLGPFRVTWSDGTPIEFRTRKQRALLAYLAVEADRPHQREVLAELLWPERPEGTARRSLRQALTGLRRAMGDEYLLTTRHTIQFNATSSCWLDVIVYQAHMQAVHAHLHKDPAICPICMGHRQQAVALYRGDFLDGLVPDDCLGFQEWTTFRRENFFRQQVEALQQLSRYNREMGVMGRRDLERARRYTRRWVELDPLSEVAHRERMIVLALSDQRRAALEQYEICRHILVEELGIDPAPKTKALRERIRAGQMPPLIDARTVFPRQNLPMQLTPFVGRERELAQLGQLLRHPEYRLLTAVGPGGVGKTRLALRAAAQAYKDDLFADGVWFVPTATIPTPDLMAAGVAQALGLTMEGKRDPLAQILDHLKSRTLLLVLDSLEHLLGANKSEGGDVLLEILREASGVKILVTSRERLNFQAEFLLRLEGLPYPPQDLPDLSNAIDRRCAAVQLFLERAGRVRVGFAVTEETLPPIINICGLVDGLPLGIELAAASLHPTEPVAQACSQVAQAIQESLDALSVCLHDLPQRQRSIRAVFEHSWQLLSKTEQVVYRRLSVFRDGFTADAARAVVGNVRNCAKRLSLQTLVDKSLLRQEKGGRYGLHSLLRQYVAEKLAEQSEEESATQERHASFYLAFLQEREEALLGEDSREALDEIWEELGNVRAAWRWAVAEGQIAALDASLAGLARFYNLNGFLREAEVVFGDAAARAIALTEGDGGVSRGGVERLACRLLVAQASFLAGQGQYTQVLPVATKAVELACTTQSAVCEAQATFCQGEALWRKGQLDKARFHLERALSLIQSDPGAGQHASSIVQEVETGSLNCLAAIHWSQGYRAEAERYLQQALNLAVRWENRQAEARLLGNLGVVTVEQGKYAEARQLFRRSLEMHRTSGNRRGASIALGNLGNIFLYLGVYGEARSHYEQSVVIQREIGDRNDEALSLGNLGLVHHYLGDDESAVDYSQQALDIAQQTGERRTQGAILLKLGHALVGLGRLDEAAEAYRQSVALRREMNTPNLVMEPLAGLASGCMAQDEPGEALICIEEILAHLTSGGTLDGTISPFQIYLTCYHVLETHGDPRASTLLATAHELLLERESKIADEMMRRSFLENVAAHCELIAHRRRAA